jgi:ubiquinone/menaquinone biosynthesis C-methylase UbiE
MALSEKFWSTIAPVYGLLRKNPISRYFLIKEQRAIKILLATLNSENITNVCEMGVGRGHSISLIPKKIPANIAIDKSLSMIHHSRKLYPKVIFLQADVVNLPFRNSSFDLILCIGLGEYVKELETLLTQLFRVLTNDGHLLISYSPRNILTFLRFFRGHRIYARNSSEIKNCIKKFQFEISGFEITPIQHQYLLQKKEDIEKHHV